eukprot:15446664-Alexandrium_andersonii.AAC.1
MGSNKRGTARSVAPPMLRTDGRGAPSSAESEPRGGLLGRLVGWCRGPFGLGLGAKRANLLQRARRP